MHRKVLPWGHSAAAPHGPGTPYALQHTMHKIFTPFAAIIASMTLTSAISIAHHQYKKHNAQLCAKTPIMSPMADWCIEQQMLPKGVVPQYRYQAVLRAWN